MSQTSNIQERTKAFEEALVLLQGVKNLQQVRFADLLNFLCCFLQEGNQNQYATIVTFALKMASYSILINQQNHQLSTQFCFEKLNELIANKLSDNNKMVRQESYQYFLNVHKMVGLQTYATLILDILEGYVNSSSPLTNP
jgi:hypothetical protein